MDAHVHSTHATTVGDAHDAGAHDGGHANGAIGGRLLQRSEHGGHELAVEQKKPDEDAAGQWLFSALFNVAAIGGKSPRGLRL
jgi:hypothetical protein